MTEPDPGAARSPALVLVATPIGNLGDLSPRAAEALRTATVVCCEDTRRTGRLYDLCGIERQAKFLVTNDHTEADQVAEVLRRLDSGESVVVVSDAGMPGISDPGEVLVRAAVEAGHRVEVIPGPSAALAALVASGLATGRFVFEGFLPRKGSGRTERLAEIAAERRTVVLYESPHRLARTLVELSQRCGDDRPVVVARELTKRHEELWRGTVAEAAAWATDREPPGEVVIVLAGAPAAAPATDDDLTSAITAALATGLSARDVADQVSASHGVPRRRAYQLVLATKGR